VALDLRKRRLEGDDPLAAKREAKARDQLANAKMMRPKNCSGRRNSSTTTFRSLSDKGSVSDRSRRTSPSRWYRHK
jgi:hypothetical protein